MIAVDYSEVVDIKQESVFLFSKQSADTDAGYITEFSLILRSQP